MEEYHSENLTAYTPLWPERMRLLESLNQKEGWQLVQIVVDEKGNYRGILKRQKRNEVLSQS
jgi:hypothetical protein